MAVPIQLAGPGGVDTRFLARHSLCLDHSRMKVRPARQQPLDTVGVRRTLLASYDSGVKAQQRRDDPEDLQVDAAGRRVLRLVPQTV